MHLYAFVYSNTLDDSYPFHVDGPSNVLFRMRALHPIVTAGWSPFIVKTSGQIPVSCMLSFSDASRESGRQKSTMPSISANPALHTNCDSAASDVGRTQWARWSSRWLRGNSGGVRTVTEEGRGSGGEKLKMLCQHVVVSPSTYNRSTVGSLDVGLVTSRTFVGCLTGIVDVGGTRTARYREIRSFECPLRRLCVHFSSSVIITVLPAQGPVPLLTRTTH
ncbi:hypothetical protein SCHPADRAFT_896381 [Schizopora paradoxa]|uniref:Uncharacterized protein n=1 Tax=Schizopora paradoxa TaxID=27342 RepID=A0A0H2R0I6_9AGAM|nr:hypothetical protein SCHPADRAFT_896381 [Schizopora paradoxa]